MARTFTVQTTARRLRTALVGTLIATPSGDALVTGVGVQQGEVWVFATIEGAGFNGSVLKTAFRAADLPL